MYLKKFFSDKKRICLFFIHIVVFLIMYNVNLYVKDVPWDKGTFYWLIHDVRTINRIFFYEGIALLSCVAGCFYLSGMLTTFSWLLIIFADNFGYTYEGYDPVSDSYYVIDEISYGPFIYIIGMMLVLLIGCVVEIFLYRKRKKRKAKT